MPLGKRDHTWVPERSNAGSISSPTYDGAVCHMFRKRKHHRKINGSLIPISHAKQRRHQGQMKWQVRVSLWIGGSLEWPLESLLLRPLRSSLETGHHESFIVQIPFQWLSDRSSGIAKISEKLFCKRKASHFQSPDNFPFLLSRRFRQIVITNPLGSWFPIPSATTWDREFS